MKQAVQSVKQTVRAGIRVVARGLNRVSGGHITPNAVTWFGFIMHLPIAWLIATGHMVIAAVLLIIFGLFDTLDGELARLQKRVSDAGGFLDASTDRFKEVLLYTGAAYYFLQSSHPAYAVWAAAACGASICVSFVKSKGEAVISAAGLKLSYPELNRMFGGGLFPFEIRMILLVFGLLVGQLGPAIIVIALGSAWTAGQRLIIISRRLV